MRKLTTLLMAVYIISLSGCALFNKDVKDIQVDVVTDPKANMSGYKTYSWLGAAEILNDPSKNWQPPKMDIGQDVKFLIDRELNKQGIHSNNKNPELAVAFFIGVDMAAQQLKDDPETQGDVLENIPQGGLVVALINIKTGFVVWVGVATADIAEDASKELVRSRLDYAVSEMFKSLK